MKTTKKLLIMCLFLLMASIVTAIPQSTNANDYFFYDDMNNLSAFNDFYSSDSAWAYSTTQVSNGTYSIQINSTAGTPVQDKYINQTAFSEYASPYCIAYEYYYENEPTAANQEIGHWYSYDGVWFRGALFLSSDSAGGSDNMQWSNTTVSYSNIADSQGINKWNYLEICYSEGFAGSGTAPANISNSTTILSETGQLRQNLDKTSFLNRYTGTSWYIGKIWAWNYTEYGSEGPTGLDPNGTITVQAINSSLDPIEGLCVNMTNSTNAFTSCNSSGTDITFTGNQENITTGLYNFTVYSVGVGDGGASAVYGSNTTEYNWTQTETLQISVEELSLLLTFLDEETRGSMAGINVSVSVIDSDNNITDYVTDTGNITITGIFTEGDYIVRYQADNYSLRDFDFTLSLDDPAQEETLYLLRQAVYTPGIVSVRNYDGTNAVGYTVNMNRYYGNDTIPNKVQSGVTDQNGNTVFTAESVTAFYTFDVILNGVSLYNETTPQLLTVDSTGLFSKTIVLEASGTDLVASNTGFSYSFTPNNELYTNTSYDFGATYQSSSWDVTYCSFSLYHANNTLISTTSGTCNAGSGSATISYTPVTSTNLYTTLVIGTELFNNTRQQLYSVNSGTRGNYTLVQLTDDLSSFSGGGFNSFTKFVISFLAIMLITLGVSSRTNYINNPEELMWLIFVLSIGFSYIDWMNLNNPLMPIQALNQYFISMVLGFIAVLTALRKWGVNE